MEKKDIKLLMEEVLHETFHDYEISEDGKNISTCSCGGKGFYVKEVCSNVNRTFDTPYDFLDLKHAIRYLGPNEWRNFISFSKKNFLEYDKYNNYVDFFEFLSDERIFPEVVVKWIKYKKERNEKKERIIECQDKILNRLNSVKKLLVILYNNSIDEKNENTVEIINDELIDLSRLIQFLENGETPKED